MKKPLFLSMAVVLLAAPGLGHADDEALRRCRGIAEATARLACYDAVPLPAPGAAPRPAPAREAASPSLLERFGMETRQPQADRIESHIPGLFTGWKANSLIRLANGQVWKVVDGSWLHGEWHNPKVSVRRGMLGAFYLDIEGESRSPRVQRVQ